jgi:hypothetical protein
MLGRSGSWQGELGGGGGGVRLKVVLVILEQRRVMRCEVATLNMPMHHHLRTAQQHIAFASCVCSVNYQRPLTDNLQAL